MKLIENLEEISLGDWIKINIKKYKSFEVGEVIKINEKNVFFILINSNAFSNLGSSNPNIKWRLQKHKLKQKKRKLKHKIKTYNNEYCIFKLSKTEQNILRSKNILKELENG